MTNFSRRQFVGFSAAALAMTLTVSACGAQTDAGSGGGANSTSFTYWSMWKEGEPQQKVIAQAIADFEKESGIKVEVEWQGRSNTQKLVPALNTNNVPDLVDGSYANLFAALAKGEQGAGLAKAYAVEADGETAQDAIPAKYFSNIELKNSSGEQWMLPYTMTSDAFWFNAAKHPELKASPPKTWEEFTALLATLKADGQNPLAADADISGYNAFYFTTLAIRNLGPGGYHKIAADKTGAAWDNPAMLDAAQKVSELSKKGYFIPGFDASKFPAVQQKWANNEAVLLQNGSWIPTETAPYAAPGFEYSSFPFPTTNEKFDSMRADFIGMSVPAKSKNADAAQKFAGYMLSKKVQESLANDANVLPVRSGIPVQDSLASVQKSLDEATSFHLAGDGVAFPGYADKVQAAPVTALFIGKITPEEFISQIKTAQIDYWKTQG